LDEEERLPIEHYDNCHVDLSSSTHICSPTSLPFILCFVLVKSACGSLKISTPMRQSLKVCKFCSHLVFDSLGSYCPRLESTGQDSRSSNPQAEQPLALVFAIVLLPCAQNIVTSCHIGLLRARCHCCIQSSSPRSIPGFCAHRHPISFQRHPSAKSALISTITPLPQQFNHISWVCFQTDAFLLTHPCSHGSIPGFCL
jgi:hypothetical protein